MTPDEPTSLSGTPAAADDVPRTRRRWPWVVAVGVLLAAVLGASAGVGIVLRGRSFGAPLASDAAVRPTFVVANVPSPSPSGSPRPVTVPTTSTASEEYTVEAGDTLRSIALQVYGDAAQWPRIYDANRQTIGGDPDTLSAGTRLRIPRP